MSYFRIPENSANGADGYILTSARALTFSPATGGVLMLNLFANASSGIEFKNIQAVNTPTSGITVAGRDVYKEVRYYEVDGTNTITTNSLVLLDTGDGKVKMSSTYSGKRALGVSLSPIPAPSPPFQSSPPNAQLLMIATAGDVYINYSGSVASGALLAPSSAVAGAAMTFSSGAVIGFALEAGGATIAGKVKMRIDFYSL